MKANNIIIFVALFFVGCHASPEIAEDDPNAMYPNVTEKEIIAKMQPEFYEALSGSGPAAMKISMALAKNILPTKGKVHPFEKWQRMAAENGYRSAQDAYAQTLWSKRNSGNYEYYSIRARYWAERAAAQGLEPSKELLKIFDAEILERSKNQLRKN
jgi:hypothetical protein